MFMTKKLLTKKIAIAQLLIGVIFLTPINVYAAGCNESGCNLSATYIQPVLDLLSGLVGVVVVISLILGGIQYSASEGDPQKSAKAKNRIAKTIFALFAYFFLFAFLQFLIPGGLFH
jgi:hypothetical protein